MAAKNFIPFKGVRQQLALMLEVAALRKHFPFLTVQVRDGKLFCKGSFQPSPQSPVYHYRIEWLPGHHPKIFPLPRIAYHDDIHIYKDGSLCLYYPKDHTYNAETKLFETIIPWTHEWFLFYELFLLKGKWLHPYVEHRKI